MGLHARLWLCTNQPVGEAAGLPGSERGLCLRVFMPVSCYTCLCSRLWTCAHARTGVSVYVWVCSRVGLRVCASVCFCLDF